MNPNLYKPPPDYRCTGLVYRQENVGHCHNINIYADGMIELQRPHCTTDQSEISDNVFLSETDSNNQISMSSSSPYISRPSHDPAYLSPHFQASDHNTISWDGVHPTWLNNGTFGTFANDSPLPPCLQCPIVMLKSPAESAARPNSVSNTPSAGQINAHIHNVLTNTNQQLPNPHTIGPLAPGHQLPTQRYQHPEANIRQAEKANLKARLQPGRLIQVSGPPMAGKSTLVKQAINEKKELLRDGIIQHHFNCKRQYSLENLMAVMIQKLCPQFAQSGLPDEDIILSLVSSQLRTHNSFFHIFVFHKCESFLLQHNGHRFSDFLSRMIIELSKSLLNVAVVFTTYKKFSYKGPMMETMEIDALSDIWDIISILQFYSPHIEVLNYAHICLKHLCLPEAVRLMAEKFIAHKEFRIPADELEKKIFKDMDFLSSVFDSRLPEVPEWIPQNILMSIVHFSHSIDSSFTLEHLEHVSVDQNPYEWQRIIQYLKSNYIIRSIPGVRRMAVHPLVVHYCKTSVNNGKLVLSGHWYDHSCNRYTNFLCRVLVNTEANMRIQGRKGLVYGGLIQEWPNVRYLIEQALHCNMNTYEAFFKVSLSANGLIMKCFSKEAKEFYWGLFSSAQKYGTRLECAVLEALYGNALSSSSAPANEDDTVLWCVEWNRAEQHLNSAIQMLSQEGPSYYLVWALDRRGIILHRQGKYQESLRCFEQARYFLRRLNKRALGDTFCVSDLQVEEERITQEIHETIPVIFTGNNQLARERLNRLLEHINNRCENHPELWTLLNLIGLTEQRGNNDLDSALKWYRLSYNERMYLYKVNPENLLAVLNNIAMILLEQGKLDQCIKYLNQALEIRRESGWRHYYTALTLTHLCEVYMKYDNFPEAFKRGLEAEQILKVTAKEHDMRLRIYFTLAHVRVVLRQRMEPESAREEAAGLTDHSGLRNTHVPVMMTFAGQEMNVPNFQDLITGSENCSSSGASYGAYSTDGYNPRRFQQGHSQNGPARQDVRTSPAPSFPFAPLIGTEIDPSDLSMTASDFLECGVSIHQDGSGLSDDGHKNYLASQTHNMVLNWGDHVRMALLKDAILEYIQRNEKIEQSVFNSPGPLSSRYEGLRKQAPLYYYIRDTSVDQLDLSVFLRLMVGSCHICSYVKSVYTEEMWRRESTHLLFTRQERERFILEFDRMRLGTCLNDNLNLSSQTPLAADVSFKSSTLGVDSNKVGTGCGSKMVGSLDFHSNIREDQSLPEAENVIRFLDNPLDSFHSADNNLSPPVESPKIIEEQKELLLRLTRRSPQEYGAVGGLNIIPVQQEFDNNLASCNARQEKVSLGSKVLGIVREPIEQSENDSLFSRNDFPSGEYTHPVDNQPRHSAVLHGHQFSKQKYFADNHNGRNSLGNNVHHSAVTKEHSQYQYYHAEHSAIRHEHPVLASHPASGHNRHLLHNTEPHQPSLADVKFPPTESQETSASYPQPVSRLSEPLDTSTLSQLLMKVWPLDAEKDNQNLGALSDASKSSSSSSFPFFKHYIKDILNPVNCPPANLDPNNNNNNADVDTKRSLVVENNNASVSLFGSGPPCLAGKLDPAEVQASSLAESGFAGSSLCSSEDELQHQAMSRNMLSHSSHVTNESGYASGGAIPKTNRVNTLTDPAPRNPSCVNSVAGGFQRQESFASHKEPCESCELSDNNAFNLDREPDEDSWCDTIVPGQCSGENFITVVPNQLQRAEFSRTSSDSTDHHIHNCDKSSTSGD